MPQASASGAIGLNGTCAAFHASLGSVLRSQGNLNEAAACHRRGGPGPLSGHRSCQRAGRAVGTFCDTAAVMQKLDLVLACDTAAAHLAGALGVPVWVALPFAPDWRWLLDRSDSPWYPTMRLFRQGQLGNWEGVFAEIQAALCGRMGIPAHR